MRVKSAWFFAIASSRSCTSASSPSRAVNRPILLAQAGLIGGGEFFGEFAEDELRLLDRLVLVVGEQRQQAFGEPRQIPQRDARLVGVGVAALLVDRGEHLRRIVVVHEGAGAVVDGLARDRGVVGVHDAVDEADQQPARDQIGLPRDDAFEQRVIGALGLRRRPDSAAR